MHWHKSYRLVLCFCFVNARIGSLREVNGFSHVRLLFGRGPLLLHGHLRPSPSPWTCSNPLHICWQAEGWLSTKRLSCLSCFSCIFRARSVSFITFFASKKHRPLRKFSVNLQHRKHVTKFTLRFFFRCLIF